MPSIHFNCIVNLSHLIRPGIALWPNDPPVVFRTEASLDKDGYHLRSFSMGEHSATHMNAPNSFDANAMGIDGYTPGSLVRPAVVVDLASRLQDNPDYVIDLQDIEYWERAHGLIPEGCVVLFHTGWQSRWQDRQRFFNEDAHGLHFPGIGAATTQFLLEQRQIAGIGIDTHGVDPGQETTFASNRLVLQRGGIILECLNHLDQLPATGSTLVIGVLRLEAGSGSPASVLAFVP
ncbi:MULTISPECIES: cyclase family protein [Pseudomonas]|uniref:cyclase family protein n=1 Tax=Pseudomonas TaxID=286 RepID=UPI001BEC5114|nr:MULTISPECIES: cyclase family protein [Pseudomonas]MBT2338427.1 cyclase family protein [Pseudomonas fluorescens]MCD4531130.1 cyclase family protein [Pseudomonas sp. C3-2018]